MLKTILCSSQIFLIFLFFTTYFHHRVHSHDDTSRNAEKAILLQLKEHWLNPINLSHWSPTSNHCTWPEITCINGSVVEFKISPYRYEKINQSIPPVICDLKNLMHIDLRYNYIPGPFPTSLCNCSMLKYLDLSGNSITGNIPENIDRILSPQLEYLDLSYNRFSGSIPTATGDMTALIHIDFSSSFGIPAPFPTSLCSCSKLKYMDLSKNKFFGSIPLAIGRLSGVEHLDLSENELSGEIPSEIWHLPSLGYLDLSNNNFSGNIPPGISIPSLYFANVSSTLLCGGILGMFNYVFPVYHDLNDIPDYCRSNPPPPAPKKHLSKIRFAVIFSVPTVAIFLIMVILFYILRRYKLKMYELDSSWKFIPFQKLDFTESTILSSLTENNLIGSGGSGNVYRVQTNSSGEHVAVKRIFIEKKLDEKLEKQFNSEVQILGTIRHLNILRLMCYISSCNTRLLVYEYMENGSLDQWLHCKGRPPSISSSLSRQTVVLKWPKRLQIAIGAAQGLCYMHHCSSSPTIHRDLKSSNILLDSEFNPKIADFGLARILDKDCVPSTMSTVAGTFGYIAPEYAQTAKVNEKVDIYSFGVILLELVTGRRAHQGDENTSLAEWAWLRHIQQQNPIADALDEEIKDPNNLDEMIKMFKLGIWCTHTLPSNRPTMREVQEILLLCTNPTAPRVNNIVPLPINSIRETRKIVFSLQTGAEIFGQSE